MSDVTIARVGPDRADYGMKLGITLSVLIHLMIIAAFVVFSLLDLKPRKPPIQAISVGLADPRMAQRGGKETKNPPVMRNTQKTQKPKPKTPKKEVRKEAPKPKKDQVGLNPEKKTEKKTASPPVEQNTPPRDTTPKRTNVGGTGGAEESGVAFELSSKQQDMNVDVEFAEYYRQVLNEVGRRWTKGGLEGGTANVTFEILRDGSIQHVEISESSGRSHLDGPAKRAVLSARFPPLPQGYRDDKLIFTIIFRYGD